MRHEKIKESGAMQKPQSVTFNNTYNIEKKNDTHPRPIQLLHCPFTHRFPTDPSPVRAMLHQPRQGSPVPTLANQNVLCVRNAINQQNNNRNRNTGALSPLKPLLPSSEELSIPLRKRESIVDAGCVGWMMAGAVPGGWWCAAASNVHDDGSASFLPFH